MLPGGVKFPSSTLDQHTISPANFIPDKFNLKQETEPFKQKQKASESNSQNNTPARIMYVQNSLASTYLIGEIILKNINYTNLKLPNWDFSISKINIFLCTVRKKMAIRSNRLNGKLTLICF